MSTLGSTIASLKIRLGVDSTGVDKGVASAEGKLGGFARGAHKALLPAVAALGALGLAAKVGFDKFNEQEKVQKQTEAALKSTGNAANVTKDHVIALSDSIANMSGLDDDQVNAAEDMILSFTNIRNEAGKNNDIFDQTTKTVADVTAAFQQMGKTMSPTDMAIQLGKALNDPAHGMAQLQRIGITFTDSQKKAAKAMEKSGNVMGAQKLILGELQKEYGGSAAAAGQTLAGKISIAKQAFQEMTASIISGAMPAIGGLAGILARVSGFLEQHKTLTVALVSVLGGLALAVIAVNIALKLYAATQAIVTAAQWAFNAAASANPYVLLAAGVAALVAGIVILLNHFGLLGGAWDAMKAGLGAMAGFFTTTLPGAFQSVVSWLKTNWPLVAVLIAGPFAPLVALATNAFGVRSALVGAFTAAKAWVSGHWPEIAVLIAGPFAPLVALATNAFGVRSALMGAGNAVLGFFRGGWTALSSLVAAPFHEAVGGVRSAINSMIGAINTLINGWNSIRFTMPSIDTHIPGVGKIGGFSIGVPGIPNIPSLDSGGWVTQDGLARVHRGEWFSGVRAPAPAGGGGTIVVPLIVNGREFAKATVDDMARALQKRADRGGSPVIA